MNVSLPKQLEEFVASQVGSGRFESKDEVVRAALRQMEEEEGQRTMRAFETAFRDIDQNSPPGEPTEKDWDQIDRIVKTVRAARRQREAA